MSLLIENIDGKIFLYPFLFEIGCRISRFYRFPSMNFTCGAESTTFQSFPLYFYSQSGHKPHQGRNHGSFTSSEGQPPCSTQQMFIHWMKSHSEFLNKGEQCHMHADYCPAAQPTPDIVAWFPMFKFHAWVNVNAGSPQMETWLHDLFRRKWGNRG